MTTYRLSCGHEFTADNVDHELRDRMICPDCFDTGVLEYRRWVVAVRP